MSDVFHAFTAFFDHLRAIAWTPVLFALACQLAKTAVRTRAWRKILAAAYPATHVRWRSVYGAYVAGAGVNAIIPVRGGDLLKLSLVKRRIEGATYATLGSSLLVETIVDAVLSTALLLWALQQHVLPGVQVLNHLPSVDWFWLFRHPRAAAVVAGGTLVVGSPSGSGPRRGSPPFASASRRASRSSALRAATSARSSPCSSSTGCCG